MKHLKKYNLFINESKFPNIRITIDELLKLLDEEVDIFRIFSIDKDQVTISDNIEKLYNNNDFNHKLDKNELKKDSLQDTSYNETLLDENITLKFFFIHKKNEVELEEPEYIILQYLNKKDNKQSSIKGFKNFNKINTFYQKLTDSTVELTDGKKTYIYQTTNGGNNWEMKNVQMETGVMKGSLDKEELNDLIKKMNIVK